MGRICQNKDCKTRAIFNNKGQNQGKFCSKHKLPKMIDVIHKKCIFDGCNKQPTFNKKGGKKALFCFYHKEDKMISVRNLNKICVFSGCTTRASFNYDGETKGICCSKHKAHEMVNVIDKKCIYKGCNKRPSFNKKGKTAAIYCFYHKEDKMISVRNLNKICVFSGCTTRASFNNNGETRAMYCSVHKKNNMHNVLEKRICSNIDCKKRGNYKDDNGKLYCFAHKQENHILKNSRKCKKHNCNKFASFNSEGENNPLYCKYHKIIGMIDICSRICDENKCKIQAHFGYVGESPTKCVAHKCENMIYDPRRRCKQTSCNYFASYGLKPNCQEYCPDHAPEKYICLTNRKCKNAGKDPICLEIDILNDKGLCRECDPSDYFKFRKKAKEELVKQWLDCSEHNDYITYDKSHPEFSECFGKKYRPDFLFDCATHYVILEVDENQHKSKPYECDLKRMCDIAQSLGMHTIFIRYNPNSYRTNGIKYEPSDTKRKDYLMRVINYCKKEIPIEDTCYLRTTKLYFDNFSESNFKLEDIDIFNLAIN